MSESESCILEQATTKRRRPWRRRPLPSELDPEGKGIELIGEAEVLAGYSSKLYSEMVFCTFIASVPGAALARPRHVFRQTQTQASIQSKQHDVKVKNNSSVSKWTSSISGQHVNAAGAGTERSSAFWWKGSRIQDFLYFASSSVANHMKTGQTNQQRLNSN